ncbi:MAG: hypothetical protein J6A07_02725 [Firmicutes bacterium]|nr:hypothetical protein [Bacillota bacterium]
MLDVYTVSFFGHRDVYYSKLLESRLDDVIFRFIQEYEFVAFLTGYDGEFDRSDFIVFWIERESGEAYRTMQYAKKYGKEMINLTVQAE